MHVLYYHQHFTTPEGSTGTRSYEVARRLVAAGHRVTMVCGAGALAKTGLCGPFAKGRRIGMVDGIEVIELELPYSNYDTFLRRVWTFVRFAASSVGLALTLEYDVLFATSTPLTAAVPGIVARWLRRKPFVFEVRDLWPELPRAMGVIRNPGVLLLLDGLEWAAYRSAQACVALSPGIAAGIARRAAPGARIVTAPNGCDLELFTADLGRPLPEIPGLAPDAFVAAFTGAHGIANGLDAVLDAAAALKARGRADIRLLFVGDGKEKPRLVERARSEALDNCIFAAPVSKLALTQLLCRRIDVGLMILANVPAFYYGTSPNKFFDYLAAGLPVIVNYPGWMAEMVQQHTLGIAVPPDDAAAFADALMKLADAPAATVTMGTRARELARTQYARDDLTQRVVALLEEVSKSA
jgi:glycosyltransferase involved in cell wall biosynthesis